MDSQKTFKNIDPSRGFSEATELSFDDFKKSLGLGANKYSDEEIERMRIICDRIADLFFDSWLNKKNSA